MTPKEKVIPSAIKWMTKLAATMTHPQPDKEIGRCRAWSTAHTFILLIVFVVQRTSVGCQVDVILILVYTLAS